MCQFFLVENCGREICFLWNLLEMVEKVKEKLGQGQLAFCHPLPLIHKSLSLITKTSSKIFFLPFKEAGTNAF